MSATAAERQCTKCNKRLRSNNTGTECSSCKTGLTKSLTVVDGEAPARGKRADVRKRFKIVADALGFEGDALIDSFCAAWLERVRGSVQPTGGDDL